MRSAFFGNTDQRLPGHFALQNPTMLRVRLNGEVLARPGTMVACQGKVDVEFEGAPLAPPPPQQEEPGGIGGIFKRKPQAPPPPAAGGAPLMRCRGQGLVFLSGDARSVHMFYLEQEALTVNGTSLLAFDSPLNWDIQPTADAYVTTVHGTGWVAVTAQGTPVLLDSGRAPTFVDAPSAVCWSADLQIGVNPNGRGGRALQLAFQGQGFVLVEAGDPL